MEQTSNDYQLILWTRGITALNPHEIAKDKIRESANRIYDKLRKALET
jgi:hypothetical protein